jgi:hypothetical protein
VIARNELFDRILEEAKKHDAYKVLITSKLIFYRVADPVNGTGPDGMYSLPSPVEIRESDLERIFADSTWTCYQLQDTYEYEGAPLRLLAAAGVPGTAYEGIGVNIAKAASRAEYVQHQAALRPARSRWMRAVAGALDVRRKDL